MTIICDSWLIEMPYWLDPEFCLHYNFFLLQYYKKFLDANGIGKLARVWKRHQDGFNSSPYLLIILKSILELYQLTYNIR